MRNYAAGGEIKGKKILLLEENCHNWMSNYPTEPKPESKNSVFANTGDRVVCGFPLLKIRDSEKNSGPAFDIVDETLYHFRINIFMRDFPIKSDADRLFLYLTFYSMKCLKCFGKNKNDMAKSAKEIESWNMNAFPIPGDGGFILSHLTTPPKDESEKADIRNYLRQCRIEVGKRLLKTVYSDPKAADKWWICFAPRKFMDRDMQN